MDRIVPPLVFFGTGPVAAESLELLAKNFRIEAVITKPSPKHHRGSAPVLDVASALGIQILTVANKTELDELMASKPVKSELAVLIDFGIIISQEVIDYFPIGIVNSHFSVLPDLRGADPITFAILSGQKQTGVSLMKVVKAMDEGPLFSYGEFDLTDDITTPELTHELILLSDALLTARLPVIYSERQQGVAQTVTNREVSYSRRLTKEDGLLDFSKPAVVLEREVRAYIGWPGSRTQLNGLVVTVTQAHVTDGAGTPGEIILSKTSLSIQTASHRLSIDRIKPSGKKEMDISSFIAGYADRLRS